MRIFRNLTGACGFFLLLFLTSSAFAQSDAEIALGKARTAFQNEQFQLARDLATEASMTDDKNPDVFLLIGKANFQLGQLDNAMAAWRKVLTLAPNHAYAKRMVTTLEGNLTSADVRLQLIRGLVSDGLLKSAHQQLKSLRASSSLTAAQIISVLRIDADLAIRMADGESAIQAIRELLIRDPAANDSNSIRLLMARARIAVGGDSVSLGLIELKRLVEVAIDSPEGLGAQLALISYRLRQGDNVIEDLAAWIEKNSDHADVHQARQYLLESVDLFFTITTTLPPPKPESPLSIHDRAALKATAHAFSFFTDPKDMRVLAQKVVSHIDKHYVANKAYAAAASGLDELSAVPLSKNIDGLVEAAIRRVRDAQSANELNKIIEALAQGTSNPAVLIEWIDLNSTHPMIPTARRQLITVYLERTRQEAPPNKASKLSENDSLAIQAAAMFMPQLKTTEITALVNELTKHVHDRYVPRRAFDAAIAGVRALLELDLPPAARLAALNKLLEAQVALADHSLSIAAVAGQIQPGPMPQSLKDVAATIQQMHQEFPARSVWKQQAGLAARVAAHSTHISWPTKVINPKPTQQWALELAIPVIQSESDTKSVAAALALVNKIVEECVAVHPSATPGFATSIHKSLLDSVTDNHTQWRTIVLKHIDLLVSDALAEFEDNVSKNSRVKNASLTETQERVLQLMSALVADQPALSSTVLKRLETHLGPWLTAGHDKVVEQAYTTLQANLPLAQRRAVRLAMARSQFGQVLRKHGRLMANGFMVPRAIDPFIEKSLKTCYELEAETGEADPLTVDIRKLRQSMISHYLALEYYDTVEVAIRVKSEPADSVLDEAIELQLAGLKRTLADRLLARELQQHEGDKNIALTPEFNEAIAAFKKFVQDHPTSPRVEVAVNNVLAIGASFEQHQAWTVAHSVYIDLETFAKGIEALSIAAPGSGTVAERSALAGAAALSNRATNALQQWQQKQGDDADPPQELSDEFKAALAAWTKVISDYRETAAAKTSMARIMGIAQEYAALDAWDVADSLYESLLGLGLPLSHPDRLEFARAVCVLGKVMPEHARQVLAMLTREQLPTKVGDDDGETDESLLAGLMGGGGFAGSGYAGGGGAGGGGMPVDPAANATSDEGGAMGALGAPAVASAGAKSRAATAMPARESLEKIAPDQGGLVSKYEMAFRTRADAQLLAALQSQRSQQAQRVAMLRDSTIRNLQPTMEQSEETKKDQKDKAADNVLVLSDAELERQQTVLDVASQAFQALRQKYAHSSTSVQAREEIMFIVSHWRGLGQWERAALAARRFLNDNPRDSELPKIRQEIARDYLAWASQGLQGKLAKQEMLEEINRRFNTAREELRAIIAAFPSAPEILQLAQWDVANSYLSQARVVAVSSPTLARGQFVRAATELLNIASVYHDHPQIESIPNMLWSIADELTRKAYFDEAIDVWNKLTIRYPTNPLADQASLRIAQTWHQQLKQPLRAVESYLELNFARGGTDPALQESIYQIALTLKTEKRWVESLHVLQTFVDSFPVHKNAGQALTMIGQIHQANEVWNDAIEAYGRVISEYNTGTWTVEAKWAIAECTINLSRWQEAVGAYAEFQNSNPKDARVAEAVRRIEVLKTLARYQHVVDEEGQRKAFDAQYQIGSIVRKQLANPVKAIIEYSKVATKWPQSHLADDALFEIGKIYLERGETESARVALLQAAGRYPESPLADDALVLVGTSYLNEADKLAAVDRSKSISIAKAIAQKEAYKVAQDNRRRQTRRNLDQIEALKKSGTSEELGNREAHLASQALQFDSANAAVISNWAEQQAEVLTAAQMADRQDKINAALRRAVASFREASKVTSADKADDALLQMARIYDERLKDAEAAMSTWKEIVKQYSGTTVAEDASWKIASYYERHQEHRNAIDAYQAFLRNYRRSPRAGDAQAAIAESHENLGEWVLAMDAYTNYINNFPEGPLAKKARDQINWIKTYRL